MKHAVNIFESTAQGRTGQIKDMLAPPRDDIPSIDDSCLAMQGVGCRRCQVLCPAEAIRFRQFAGGFARPFALREHCDACGLCLGYCPVSAIRLPLAP